MTWGLTRRALLRTTVAGALLVPFGRAVGQTLPFPGPGMPHTSGGGGGDITSNLTAYWPLNEGSGTTAGDISGNGFTGTLTNGPTWVPGHLGQAVQFDGVNDGIAIVDNTAFTLTVTQSYTWAFWLKPLTSFREWSAVWAFQASASTYFLLYAHTTTDSNWGPVTAGLSAGWSTTAGSVEVDVHTANNVLTLNTWAHVIVRYTAGLAQAARFSIFVNGVDQTATGDVFSVGTIATINPTTIWLGQDSLYSGELFTGVLDEIRFYTRALATADIAALAVL